jgi:hypothetical protein
MSAFEGKTDIEVKGYYFRLRPETDIAKASGGCSELALSRPTKSRHDEGVNMSILNTGFVIFHYLMQLDFTGPPQVFSRLPQSTTCIVAKTAAAIQSDCGLGLLPIPLA